MTVWSDKAARLLNRAVIPVGTGINSVGMAVLMAMMLLTVADVSLRYLLNRPIKGAYELTEIMMLVIVFFGMAYTASKNRHIVVDVVVSRFPQQAQVVIESVTCLVSLGICSLIAWHSFVEAKSLWLTNETTGSLLIPVYPFVLVVAFGCAVLSLALLVKLFDSLGKAVSGSWKAWLGLIFGGMIALALATTPVWLAKSPWELSRGSVGVLGIVLLLLLLASRMPIGFVLALLGFLGFGLVRGVEPSLAMLGIVPHKTIASVPMSIVPLFILMGQFTFHSGIGQDLFEAAHKWLGNLRGGLAIATVGACGLFAACTGSSVAGAVTMGRVALPEMKRHKYDPALATGCIAAGGTLGILIPPSIAFVMYGIMTNTSIGQLLISGIVPGVLLVFFYMAVVYILCIFDPQKGPPGPKVSFRERMSSLKGVWGMLVLFLLVMGGIYQGFFTATEAGAVGAFGAFVIALARRRLNRRTFFDSLIETGLTSAMLFIIFVGAYIFGYFLTATRLPMQLAELVAGLVLNRYLIIVFIMVFYIFLGCILDVSAMILITIPIIFPIVVVLGFDPIWFGVFIVIMCEMGMITPPVGMNVFALSGVATDVPLYTIFRGIVPFLIADICLAGLLLVVPQIALFLPNMMK